MTFEPVFAKGDIVYLVPKKEMLRLLETDKNGLAWSLRDIEEFTRQSCFGKPIQIRTVSEDKWGVYYITRETNPWKIRDWMLMAPSCDIASEDEYVSIFS